MPSIGELARCLKAYRIYRGIENPDSLENERVRDALQKIETQSLRDFEKGLSMRMVTIPDVQVVIDAYGMSSLMVDHLLVNHRPANIVVQAIPQFARHPGPTGRNAEYYFPTHLLRVEKEPVFPHAFFVRVLLPSLGDVSQQHNHPGDEIILCRQGSVRVVWPIAGLQTELQPGDYVHFYADQEHMTINIGEGPVELFIIRNYMIEDGGPRRHLYVDAHDFEEYLLNKSSRAKPADAIRRVRAKYKTGIGRWLKQTLRSLSDSSSISEGDGNLVIRDPIGLATQLARMGFTGYNICKTADAALKERRIAKRITRFRSEQIMSGFFGGNKKDLETIAAALDVPPVLFYSHLFPRVPGICVVRAENGFQSVVQEHKEQGVRYRFPKQNLADSRLNVFQLELAPGCSCDRNHHAGTEFCLPLDKSQVEVQAWNGVHKKTAAGQAGEYVHYDSGKPHWVKNTGQKSATALVIRFFN